ncbi:hypothetical protein glysoja_017443 [Glycine soja]|nr:hypothetical protein glysoja_017443 [Glycine soja]
MMHQQQEVEEEEASPHNKASPSPSFSSYSSETLAEIAARVIEELRHEPSSLSDDDDDALFPPWENLNDNENFLPQNDEPPEQNDDDDFEFAFFPNNNNIAPTPRRRLPLRKLMFEEGETASWSTDESVDLEGVAEGAYCVWTPNSVGSERKKSNSTGSTSKRWKLRVRDLLLRSHSDGKNNNKQEQQKQRDLFRIATKPQNGSVGTEQQHHVEQNKRKSFLPYKPELVGLFTNANGLGRNLRPF